MGRLRFAMVCASNMNRSMEAHNVLHQAGLTVSSFGLGRHVKLPGPAADKPNVYEFGTPYETMERDLMAKDYQLYTNNGILEILSRNKSIKPAPQRWQLLPVITFDVVMTFEQWLMDVLLDNMASRAPATNRPLLVINIDVKDSPTEAKKAGQEALQLCQALEAAGDEWLDKLESIMDAFYQRTHRRPVYNLVFC